MSLRASTVRDTALPLAKQISIIKRLSDDNDARRLEKALAKLEGVLEAQVTFTTEKARVKYIPTIVTQAELRRAVSSAGFEAVELGGEAEDAEAHGART